MPATRARTAVALVFALNGFAFASWASRVPEVRTALDLSPGALGLLLLSIAAGSVLSLPASGPLVHRVGAARVVAGAAVVDGGGLALAGAGVAAGEVALTAGGLFLLGVGSGSWDVAMNVEGAAVERELARSIMPRFHAAWSLGTVAGAGLGAVAAALSVPVAAHLLGAALVAGLLPAALVRSFLPAAAEADPGEVARPLRGAMRAWTEPRTLVIGVMVLAMAFTEGTANDWLAVALVDGYGVGPAVGASGFAVFVTAMTAGRLVGPALLDRFGRLAVLRGSMLLAGVGVLVVVFGEWLPLVALGTVVWGVGASLGFPVGMSAAADDPEHAAARVAVVSTIGYTAFLAGPPLIGFLADSVGTLSSLLVVAVLIVPSVLAVGAARPLPVAARDDG
ncbi:MAG TPA: MFS transporter [Actinomycetales bacterium]|nr:MFS transporter [Actinomycetales bacterium]